MNELIEFLTARLAEDEAIARAVDDNSPPWTGEWIVRDARALGTRNGWCLAYPHDGREFAPGLIEHIARHDPARALREVEAKRAVIELHGRAESHPHGCVVCSLANESCGCVGTWAEGWPCETIKRMAGVWHDHPDWRAEWAT